MPTHHWQMACICPRHKHTLAHKPSPASQSTPWGKPWAYLAWRCTAGQCSPSAAVECCVSAHTAHTPSGSAPPRCSYFQMPWRQPQPCSVTSNLCAERKGKEAWCQIISAQHWGQRVTRGKRAWASQCELDTQKNVRMWEKWSRSEKAQHVVFVTMEPECS